MQKNFSQMKKNTVTSKHQLTDSKCVRFYHTDRHGLRILFAGNSITLHGPKADIGWDGNWGMAASCPEKDYVHLLMNQVEKSHTDASYCICHVSDWERGYRNPDSFWETFLPAQQFDADIIILRLVENCPADGFHAEAFHKSYSDLVRFLNPNGRAKLIFTTGFWRHPGDEVIQKTAEEFESPCVELGDLGEQDEMKAVGLFWHEGVASHPGDLGMKQIAERILKELSAFL